MHRSLKIVMVTWLLLLTFMAVAQDQLLQVRQNYRYLVPYHKDGSGEFTFGNKILREIAKDVLREPWLVRVNLSGDLSVSILEKEGKPHLQIGITGPFISGDTLYRNFPVVSQLLPAQIRLRLKWANKADTSGFSEAEWIGKLSDAREGLIFNRPIQLYDPDVDTLLVRDISFFYDSAGYQSFMARIGLIHDYYASVALLDSLHRFINETRTDETSMLAVNYLKAEEADKVLKRIDHRNFKELLLTSGPDHLHFIRKYEDVYKLSRTLLYNIIDKVNSTPVVKWDRNIAGLADYFTSRIFSYVRRSFLMDQDQGLIFEDCLRHFFDQGAFPTGENITGKILDKLYPEAKQDTLAAWVSHRIYDSYRRCSQNLIFENKFAEASSMMANGALFIEHNPFLAGFSPDDELQSTATTGIYNSYVGIASTCILNHRYEMADAYLLKAWQYASVHPEYIRSDSSYRSVFSKLFFLRNRECDLLLEEKKFDEALACYKLFEQVYPAKDLAAVREQLDLKMNQARLGLADLTAAMSQQALVRRDADTALFYYEKASALILESIRDHHPEPKFDSLAPAMAAIKYDQLVREASTALEKSQFTLSVNRFSEARRLATDFRLNRNHEFDSLYKRAMKNYLIIQLSTSVKKIWANQFDSAREALHKFEVAGFDYGLLNDDRFMEAGSSFKRKISEQKCRNLSDSVNIQFIRADRNIMLKNYSNAIACFNHAMLIMNSDTGCHFNLPALKDSLSRYSPAADYQRNEKSIGALVGIGDYEAALLAFTANQQLFVTAKLTQFGMKPANLYDFSVERNNPYLTAKIADSLAKNGEEREALRYLYLMKMQGVGPDQAKSLQHLVGKVMAKSDMEIDSNKGSSFEPATSLLLLNVSDPWFAFFREAYMKECGKRR